MNQGKFFQTKYRKPNKEPIKMPYDFSPACWDPQLMLYHPKIPPSLALSRKVELSEY